MEGGQRDRVRQRRGERDVAKLAEGPVRIDLGSEPLDHRRGIVHSLDECGHLRGLDAGQVIADRHVEHVRPRVVTDVLAERFPLAEHLDDHRRLHVLVEALGNGQLLAPLDVVADRLHVDAGSTDLEIVEDLHRLQLEEAAAAQPGEHDVLRHLTVWSGRRTDRRRRRTTQELEREIDVVGGLPEPPGGQIEDAVAGLELEGDAVEEHLQRHGGEWGSVEGHQVSISSRAANNRAACSVALARISAASTRVATPLRSAGSPSMSTSMARTPVVKASRHGSIGS